MLDLIPMHVGMAVADLDASIALFSATGISPWVRSPWKTARYWDERQGRVVEAVSRVGFARLQPDFALELIETDATHGDVPEIWRVGALTGPPHIGYWCADVEPVAMGLLADGAELALARAIEPFGVRAVDVAGRTMTLPDRLDTSFYTCGAGPLVELVPTAIWETRLPELFGPGIRDVLPAPPQPHGGNR